MNSSASSWKRGVWFLAGTLLLTLSLLVSLPAASQNGGADGRRSAESKPTPRTADGHPDLNGFWNNPPSSDSRFQRSSDGSILFEFSIDENSTRVCLDDSCQAKDQPSYKSEYMAKVKEIAQGGWGGTKQGDPTNECRPAGVPRAFGAMQIVQTPKITAIVYEASPYTTSRLIYTDGRAHPPDLDPSFMGDSTGHWEGDSLVVDVVGLNDQTWLGVDLSGRHQYTSIHSDQEHVIERWTRKGDMLTYEATVEDPVMFTKLWVITPRHLMLARSDDTLLESICTPFDATHYVKPKKGDTGCPIRCTDDNK
jgi:hypothetical protein